jgi:hypothetical protein
VQNFLSTGFSDPHFAQRTADPLPSRMRQYRKKKPNCTRQRRSKNGRTFQWDACAMRLRSLSFSIHRPLGKRDRYKRDRYSEERPCVGAELPDAGTQHSRMSQRFTGEHAAWGSRSRGEPKEGLIDQDHAVADPTCHSLTRVKQQSCSASKSSRARPSLSPRLPPSWARPAAHEEIARRAVRSIVLG